MGIVNVTPDSFYSESRTYSIDKAIERALKLVQDGADILDIGGESTRPDAEIVSLEEELLRVIPVIKAVREMVKVPISIDTMKPEVAEAAIENGASIINDITGFGDLRMQSIAKESGALCIVMHMKGSPKTMQLNPLYERGVVTEVVEWLQERVADLIQAGIARKQIILDPGIGFGKTMQDNFELIKNSSLFKQAGFNLLYGVSRKSFLRRFLSKTTEELLCATLVVNTQLMIEGVSIIRVHDVAEHYDARSILNVTY
ncbi:MAG: folP [Chlamydiia bacterium]|nr:folP [Chlamydiia bacterium]